MKVSVFIATSLDGFIARENGAIDWLPNGVETNDEEDYGYQEFFDSVDEIVMGRNTYEFVLSFDEWPYDNKPVVVLSNHPVHIPLAQANTIEVCAASPHYVCQQLTGYGFKHLYVDGGRTIQSFLQAGLVDHITISQVPVLIGLGIPLFGPLPCDVRLQLTSTRSFPNGVVQSHYNVLK